MDPMIVGICGIIFLFVLVILGVHVGVALGVTGILGMAFIMDLDRAFTMTTTSIYFANASYALITLPLFVFMGLLGASGGISKTLYDSLNIWTRNIRGSLGIATVMGCSAFGAICGSSFVTAAVFAKVSAPEMRAHGYNKKLAYGVCASAGIIGMLIPPSILAVVYGILSGLSIGKLLLAGVGPGLLVAVLFCLQIYYYAVKRPDMLKPETRPSPTWSERIKTIPTFWPVFVVAVVVFGGIFGGIFSPTEAAAVSTFLILAVILITRGKSAAPMIVDSLKETGATSAMIFLTMAGALVFSRFIVLTGINQALVEWVAAAGFNNLSLMCIISFLCLVMGTIMDSTSILTITIPLITPIITAMGIDPYYGAIIIIFASQLGIITPPFGLAVFTVSGVAEHDVSIEDIFKGSLPFLAILCLCLLILILVPGVSTFLI